MNGMTTLGRLIGLGAAALLTAVGTPSSAAPPPHEPIGENLEPLRSRFNAADDHVRAVLLVAPT